MAQAQSKTATNTGTPKSTTSTKWFSYAIDADKDRLTRDNVREFVKAHFEKAR
jgi:hypothetical protein